MSFSKEEIDQEVLPFLSKEARLQVRCIALEYFLGMTGSEEGRNFIASNDKYMRALINLIDDQPGIAADALRALVNLSADENIAYKLLELSMEPTLLVRIIKYVLQPESMYADGACMILTNLSRPERCAEAIVKSTMENAQEIGLDKIIEIFCLNNFNKNAKLHYLGPYLSNLTQIPDVRQHVLDKKKCVIQRLLPFTQYAESHIRRGGIIGTLRNCCFETDYHDWLLGDDVDILPRLLLPLAGPEEFDDDDMAKLPDELQYLEPDKTREEDPDIRKMLVEAVHQLCSTKSGRLYIKEKNTYVILRELDRWEKDPSTKLAVQKLISLLIGDEPKPGMENLHEVEVPKDMTEQFQKHDQEDMEDFQNELKDQEK